MLANTLFFGNVVTGSSDPTGTSPSNNRTAGIVRAPHLTLRSRPELMRKVILAAEGNVASMILRIILSLLFERGKNIIGPQFGRLPSSGGADASVPRRDMHREKAEQNSR